MKAVLAAAAAILCTGAATAALADGSDAGSAAPVIGADSAGSGDGWGVASSAGVTYAGSSDAAAGTPVDATGQGVQQNYQFLDANVVEYTQLVSGGEVMTLSGVMLQRNGDDSDAAQLDEEASGVYTSGSALAVPTLYDAVATSSFLGGPGSQCDSICGLVAGASGSQGSSEFFHQFVLHELRRLVGFEPVWSLLPDRRAGEPVRGARSVCPPVADHHPSARPRRPRWRRAW